MTKEFYYTYNPLTYSTSVLEVDHTNNLVTRSVKHQAILKFIIKKTHIIDRKKRAKKLKNLKAKGYTII